MILTVSLNPSIDRRYTIAGFQTGSVFRTDNYELTAGGKGLNVTRVAHLLGADVCATGIIGGAGGDFIEKSLRELGTGFDFLRVSGETRSCIAVLGADGEQTEILESGEAVGPGVYSRFMEHYEQLLKSGNYSLVVASGSVLPGLPDDIYAEMIRLARGAGVRLLLDTSGAALAAGVAAGPAFIKPNLEELEAFVGKKLVDEPDVIEAGSALHKSGIDYVGVSLGADGALFVCEDGVFRVRIPHVEVRNPVGSGDSLVAGFAVGLQRGLGLRELFSLACACGVANAMEDSTGYVDVERVKALVGEIEVKKIR